jgi:hypothetical protein
MAKDPYAPPASEEEQFHEVARLLGVALHRWHELRRKMPTPSDRPLPAPSFAATLTKVWPSAPRSPHGTADIPSPAPLHRHGADHAL